MSGVIIVTSLYVLLSYSDSTISGSSFLNADGSSLAFCSISFFKSSIRVIK